MSFPYPKMKSTLKQIYNLARVPAQPLKLGYMHKLGQIRTDETVMLQAQFLQKELPVRLAGRVRDLDNLPYGLAYQSPVKTVRNLYVDSFNKIHNFPSIKSNTDVKNFTCMLQDIKTIHHGVPQDLALGIEELKNETDADLYHSEYNEPVDHFLNKFYLCRIGIRTLIDLHIQSFYHDPNPLIKTQRVKDIFDNVVEELHSIAMNERIDPVPEIIFKNPKELSITYIPSHIHFTILEVLKNAVNATVRTDSCEPVTCEIFETKDDTVIKICDKGGGFSREDISSAFSYLYTTSSEKSALSGYGHGLPLARLYTRYFGGDLILIPYKGIGTNVIIYFSKISYGTEVIC